MPQSTHDKGVDEKSVPRDGIDRALRLPEILRITGLSRSTIYKLQTENRFPQRVKLTERTAVWLESEVMAWLRSKIDASRNNSVQSLK